jgi:hypothetical protein
VPALSRKTRHEPGRGSAVVVLHLSAGGGRMSAITPRTHYL